MSLINQMLQDLEKRRASGAERGTLPDQVRVLPREETRSMPWWLVGIAGAVASLGLLAWQFNRQPASTALPPPVSQTPSGPASVLEPPASRLALELQTVSPHAAQLPAETDAESRRSGIAADAPIPRNSASRVDETVPIQKAARAPLATVAVVVPDAAVMTKPASVPAKGEPAKSHAATPPAEMPKPAVVAPPAPTVSPAIATKPAITASKTVEALPESRTQAVPLSPQIDKRAQTLTPQQLAENEYREAANFLNQGRLAEAQDGFRRALQTNPAHVGARQGLFGVLMDARRNGEAEQLLQEGLALNPNQPGFAMALASLQYERGNIADAIETMQKSAPAAQASPDYLARLAGLLQRQSRHKEAVEKYQAALRLAPGSGVWLMGLGISLQAMNRNTEAQDAFRRARSSNTLSPELQAFVDQRLKQLQ